jgi:hypothetical protein
MTVKKEYSGEEWRSKKEEWREEWRGETTRINLGGQGRPDDLEY